MGTPHFDSESSRLLSSWCDGSIDDAGAARLEDLLRSDASFRKEYLAYVDQHALLATHDLRLGLPTGLEGQALGNGERADARRCEIRPHRALLLATAALIVIGLVALTGGWPRAARKVAAPAVPALPQRAAGGVALVVQLSGVRWGPADGPRLSEGTIVAAGRYRLPSGRATLSFFSGVLLTVEGPADLDLISFDRVFCRQGRLRAHVPSGAEGFVVASPSSAVVDLGTEFALNVEPDGRSRVMVFEGAAEAALLDAKGTPASIQHVGQSKAFELDPRTGRIAESEARPEWFAAAPDLPRASLVLEAGYVDEVMQSRPRSYWRFEALADAAVPNEVADGPPLRASGPVGIAGVPEGNGYARFQAGALDQWFSTDVSWGLARTPGHAVEFWFLAEGYRHATLVGFLPPARPGEFVESSGYVHSFLVEITARERQSLNKPGSVRFLHRWPIEPTISPNNMYSEHIYTPKRWHHVVAQKRGEQIELFLDGEREHATPLTPDHPSLSCRLVVGRRAPDRLVTKDIRPFVGRLDELAIYDHPLDAQEIRRHSRRATSRPALEPSEGTTAGP